MTADEDSRLKILQHLRTETEGNESYWWNHAQSVRFLNVYRFIELYIPYLYVFKLVLVSMLVLPEALEALEVRKDWRYFGEVYGEGLCRTVTECISRWMIWMLKRASLGRFSTLETSRNRYAGGRSWFWAQVFYSIAFLILSVFFDAMWHVPWCCEFDSLGVWVLRSFSTDKSSSRNGGVWVMC